MVYNNDYNNKINIIIIKNNSNNNNSNNNKNKINLVKIK
jgi:hypothetical protein